jgi:hypothetical protein
MFFPPNGNKNGNKPPKLTKKDLTTPGQVLDFIGAGNGIRKSKTISAS